MRSARDVEPIPARFARSLGLGALAGGVLTAFWFMALVRTFDLLLAAMLVPVTALVWMIGLMFIGFPLWAALHDHAYRSSRAAIGLGATVLSPALYFGRKSLEGLAFAAALIVIGALVAWIIQRVAYGTRAS